MITVGFSGGREELDNTISEQHVTFFANNEIGLRGRGGEPGSRLQDNNSICYFLHNGSKSGGK